MDYDDFMPAKGASEIMARRIKKVWRDEQGRRCTSSVIPPDMTDDEKWALAEFERVRLNYVEYRKSNPVSDEAMEWATSEAKRLGL